VLELLAAIALMAPAEGVPGRSSATLRAHAVVRSSQPSHDAAPCSLQKAQRRRPGTSQRHERSLGAPLWAWWAPPHFHTAAAPETSEGIAHKRPRGARLARDPPPQLS
jgi:hypothetical protein